MTFHRRNAAFSLLELLIAIGIVGIVAAIAIPSYLDYSKRAQWSELVRATAPYKIAIAECLTENQGTANKCNPGDFGIPKDKTGGINNTNIESIKVSNGVVTVTAKTIVGGDTLVMAPSDDSGLITWNKSGSAVTKKLVK